MNTPDPVENELQAILRQVNPALAAETERGQRRRKTQEAQLSQDVPASRRGSSPMDAIFDAMDKKQRQDAEHQSYKERWERQYQFDVHDREAFLAHCRPATVEEYAAWVIGWLRSGGEPSHVYDGNMAAGAFSLDGNLGSGTVTKKQLDGQWWVMETPPKAVPILHGATSFQVIVPADVRFTPGKVTRGAHNECGHSTFYFMDGFKLVGHWVPIYDDVRDILSRKL